MWLWGVFGQPLNSIGPLRAIHFPPTFVSVTYNSSSLQADLPTRALGVATARFCCGSAVGLPCLFRAPSLGRCPTAHSQICLCFTQKFFSNCALFTSETKTWKLSWCVNGRADPTPFHAELILLLTSFQCWFNSLCLSVSPSFMLSYFVSWTLASGGWHFDMLLNYPFIFQPWLSLFNP